MKWLFFILLLINIGLFVWIYPQTNKPELAAPQVNGGENLLLLSEVEAVDTPSAIEEGVGDGLNKPADVESEIASTDDKQGTLSETLVEQVMQGGISDAEFPGPVDEVSIGGEIATDQDLQVEVTTEPEPMPILHCSRLGPLGKRAQADELSLRLRALGLQPDLNSELSNDQEGYWVLVPPQKNRSVAVRIVKRLQEAGITDLWRFTSGNLAHAISLGLFRDEARAEIRRKSIADKGFDVEVRPRYRQKTHYWLSYSYLDDSPLTGDQWAALAERYPGIEQHNIDCEEIATQ